MPSFIRNIKLHVVVSLALFLASSALNASTLYVKQSGGDDANNGSSWSNSLQTFSKALEIAEANASIKAIWLANGTYGGISSDNNTDPTASDEQSSSVFTISKTLEIYGGFAGGEDSLDLRSHGSSSPHDTFAGHPANATIIQGAAGLRPIYLKGANVELDGITFSGGGTSVAPVPGDGGGVYAKSGATLWRCKVKNNFAQGDGGGIYVSAGTFNVIWTEIKSNTSISGSGGGVYTKSGSFKGVNSLFSGNAATNGEGGTAKLQGTPKLYGCKIESSSAASGAVAKALEVVDKTEFHYCTFLDTKGDATKIIYSSGTPVYKGCLFASTESNFKGTVTDSLDSTSSPPGTESPVALPTDTFDLDGDNDKGEPLPLDFDGYIRSKTYGAISKEQKELVTSKIVVSFTPNDLSLPFFADAFDVTGTGNFQVGATTKLDVTAATHWAFEKWGDSITDLPRSVTVGASDQPYVAVFKPKQYNIKLVEDPHDTFDDNHRSLAWGWNLSNREDVTKVRGANIAGTPLIFSNGSPGHTFSGNFFDANNTVSLEANASKGYELFGWVVEDTEAKAKTSANDLLAKVNAGTASAGVDYLEGDPLTGDLTLIFDSDQYIVPIYGEKKFQISGRSEFYPDDLGAVGSVERDLDNSQPPSIGAYQRFEIGPQFGWEAKDGNISIGGMSLADLRDTYGTEYNPDQNKSGFNFEVDEVTKRGVLEFEVKSEMAAAVIVDVVFTPISFEVAISKGPFVAVNRSWVTIKGPDLNASGNKFGSNLFTKGSTVKLEWDVDSNFTKYKDQIDFTWKYSKAADGTQANPLLITDLDQSEVVTYEARLKSFMFTHRIYFLDPKTNEDAPFVEEKTLQMAGSDVFLPQFPSQTGYSMSRRDETGEDLNTSSLVTIKSDKQPGDPTYDYFTLDSNLTIVSVYEPKTFDLNVSAVFEEGGALDWTATPGGRVLRLPDSASGIYRYGDKVQVEAVPDTGYDLSRWLVDGVSVNTDGVRVKSLNIIRDINVTAIFVLNPMTVTMVVPGNPDGGSFEVDGKTFAPGDSFERGYNRKVLVKAIPARGYRFDGLVKVSKMSTGEILASFSPDLDSPWDPVDSNFTLSEDMKLSANFVPDVEHDFDEDGLNNYLESLYGTDFKKGDTDDDNLPDYWEVIDWRKLAEDNATYNKAFWQDARKDLNKFKDPVLLDDLRYDYGAPPLHRLNPTNPDDNESDPDFDGVHNYFEFLSRTNPIDPETVDDEIVDVFSPVDLASGGLEEYELTAVKFIIEANGTDDPGNINRPLEGNMLTGKNAVLRIEGVTDGFVFDHWLIGSKTVTDLEITDYKPPPDQDIIYVKFRQDGNDTDGDNLTNYQELYLYHTKHDDNDTDGDGLLDGLEVDNGLDADSNVTELLLLDLVRKNPSDFGVPSVVDVQKDPISYGLYSDVELNDALQTQLAIAQANSYDQGLAQGRADGGQLWADFNTTMTQLGFSFIHTNERNDLYRFIAGPSAPDQTGLGWFYTEQHGWAWLRPSNPGWIYLHKGDEILAPTLPTGVETVNWLNLNPPIAYFKDRKALTAYPFQSDQFFWLTSAVTLNGTDYPSASSNGSAKPSQVANPNPGSTSQSSGTGANMNTDDSGASGAGEVDDFDNFFKN